ncbi:MAG TPA: DUF1800 family protein, partial [Pyrinomonadaceae bacterium]|nr:DUF1800 family protein [Pyrinomonadaceae bacterium]
EPLYGYQAPTGYPDRAEDWVNTGALLERLNFGLALASNRIPGTRVDLSRFTGTADADGSNDTGKAMERFLDVIVQGDISPQTKATLLRQLGEPAPATAVSDPAADSRRTDAMGQVRRAPGRERREMVRAADFSGASSPQMVKMVGLILGSPEFQRQ